MARASVGRRARRSTQKPGGYMRNQYPVGPTIASILRPPAPVINMIMGVAPNTQSAHPSCSIAPLTCSRRCAAERPAARSVLFVALPVAPLPAWRAEGRRWARGRCAAEGRGAPSPSPAAAPPLRSRTRARRPRRRSAGSRAMRVAIGYTTATLALSSSKAASTAASSASRSSGKAAEALAGPAHRQRKPGSVIQPRSMEAQDLENHVP
eukprot:scaffold20295_cov58-Phaeocystis_antarctica.AAC.4